ncbi:DUF6221 family protein [Streptomyces asoensis]|uniref:DUF6221 family protein n=1 Tax=Streptomyces asoensis TaxID=249586 RepID=UPI0036942BE4
MQPSIVTFIETILDAEAARQHHPSTQWHATDCNALPDVLNPGIETGSCTCGVPAQVLAEIQSRRALLDEHGDVNDGECGTCVDGHWGYPTHGGSSPQRYPCRSLRLLALPYASHEAYLDEWQPPTRR